MPHYCATIFLVMSINIALAYGVFYQPKSVVNELFSSADGMKQKDGLSKIECVLVCQREKMTGLMKQKKCYCIKDQQNSHLKLKPIEENTETVLFERLGVSP